MDEHFPEFPERMLWSLEILLLRLAEDPYLFDDPDCPYSDDEIAILQRLVAQNEAEESFDPDEIEGETKWDRLQRESDKLFKGLTAAGSDLSGKDNAEKMAYFRTATSLLDKIVGIQERAANLKQINLFHDTVINIMEDVLEPGQRTAVMERLEKAAKGAE